MPKTIQIVRQCESDTKYRQSYDFTIDSERITKESTQNFILKIEEIINIDI